jgi:GDP-L-fucose synthase
MNKESKIYIAGHTGMVGSAIERNLRKKGYSNIVSRDLHELNLINQEEVKQFFQDEKPDYVFDAAAKVGGILANNTYRAQFIYENMMIQNNLIHASYVNGVSKFIFLGSSCIYPKNAPQPIKEEYLLDGKLEYTNEPYAVAKISGIKMCESYYKQYGSNFISVMPTNLFGENDNFDLKTSHVLPALIRKFHDAKLSNCESVVIWGTGKPKREFLYVDELADAVVFVFENVNASALYDNDLTHLNIGSGEDISILELAELVKKVVGYKGQIEHDTSKPDGTPRKLLDVSRLNNLGWNNTMSLEEGITTTYKWFCEKL